MTRFPVPPLPSSLLPGLAAAFGLLASTAHAQYTFSIDYRGPTVTMPPGCAAPPITAGDILSPTLLPAVICVPGFPAYAPLLPPQNFIPGSPGGLGVLSIGGCIGAPPGVPCPAELDALSYGFDFPIPPAVTLAGTYVFSVDEWAVGLPIPPLFHSVTTESPIGEGAADAFEALVIPGPSPLPFPPAAVPGNQQIVDGNGMLSPSLAHYPGVGVFEPRPAFAGPGPRPGDNVDALDFNDLAAGIFAPVYFSLDGLFPDPLYGTPNTGTAMANGFLPGDVLIGFPGGGPPAVYAPAFLLGLDFVGPGTDDLDALALWENGVPGFQPGPAYAWLGGAPSDMLLFSVRRGSAIIGLLDSLHGLPITESDILCPPPAAGAAPQILVPAEYLGIATFRTAPVPFSDDLDGLDTRRPPQTSVAYCHGDGDILPCPCGNNGAAGNGCANSAFPAGANLTAVGIASVAADSVVLQATNLTGMSAVFFQGTAAIGPFAVDDGLGCVGGAVIRFALKPVVGNATSYPQGADPLVSVRGMLPPVGGTRFYQCFYRNAAAAFCPPATSNRTNGIAIVWAP